MSWRQESLSPGRHSARALLETVRAAFAEYDLDGDGRIDADELRIVLGRAGREPGEAELEELIRRLDSDGSGTIEFDEFIALFLPAVEAGGEAEADLRSAFDDIDKDGSGSVSHAELRRALRAIDPSLSQTEVDDLLRQTDADGDGRITFEEFLRMMLAR